MVRMGLEPASFCLRIRYLANLATQAVIIYTHICVYINYINNIHEHCTSYIVPSQKLRKKYKKRDSEFDIKLAKMRTSGQLTMDYGNSPRGSRLADELEHNAVIKVRVRLFVRLCVRSCVCECYNHLYIYIYIYSKYNLYMK